MVNVLGAEIPLPSFGLGTGSLSIVFAILFVAIALGILYYFWQTFRIYNKKIIVFENIAGQGFQPVLRDRARLIKVGDGGEELLLLLKQKVFRGAYGKKMGKNTYWFAVGQDGYWYNIVLGDLDAKMGLLDIEPVDRDQRYMHVAIRKNTQERYRKIKFMDKYGTMVMSGLFLLIMIAGYFNEKSDKYGNVIRTYVEDTRKVFIQSVKLSIEIMRCDLDKTAKQQIKSIKGDLNKKYRELCAEEITDMFNAHPMIKRQRIEEGIINRKDNLNIELPFYQDYIKYQVDCYIRILGVLTDLTKRKDFFGEVMWTA